MDRPRPHPRRGPGADQHRAGPAGSGPHVADPGRRGRGAGRDEDALAYLRDAHQFHNALLVERANGNYADTMARQFLFDVWHYFLLQKLERSADERVAAIAAKALKEVTYHVRRSSDMVVPGRRHGRKPRQDAGRHRRCLALHGRAVLDDAVDQDPRAASAVCCPSCASPGPATWPRCWARPRCPCRTPRRQPSRPSRRPPGRHSEELGYVLAEMQFLPRAYPGAKW